MLHTQPTKAIAFFTMKSVEILFTYQKKFDKKLTEKGIPVPHLDDISRQWARIHLQADGKWLGLTPHGRMVQRSRHPPPPSPTWSKVTKQQSWAQSSHRFDAYYFYSQAPTGSVETFKRALAQWISFYYTQRPPVGRASKTACLMRKQNPSGKNF